MPETHLTEIRFDSFDLDPRILQGLADANFVYCTPIQAEALPIALSGQDVAGQAQTGTGKTAAFLLAIFQRLLSAEPRAPGPIQGGGEHDGAPARPRALVLAPTRELAVQIHKDTLLLARHTGFRVGLVFGGTGYQQQRDDLAAGVDILIGTPGRLIDYFKQHVFSLRAIEVVVLDEADRMFDLGFIKDIRFLLKRMPPPEERIGMLFSATLSYRVLELAYEHMNQPRMVKIEPDKVTAERVRQVCYMTANEEKIPLLIGLIRTWEDPRVMVFVNTKREADRVWGYLQGNGINTAVLSGDVPQKKRLSLLKHFTDGDLPVLVGTDVAARGLHIPDVTHVVNYDLPEDAEDYVHRIGRTARAGAAGDAISFVCETYAFCLPDVERFIGAKVPVAPLDPGLLAEIDPRSRLRPAREDREYRHEGRGGRGGRDHGHGRAHGQGHDRHGSPDGERGRGKHGRPPHERDRPRGEVKTRGPDRPVGEPGQAPREERTPAGPQAPETEMSSLTAPIGTAVAAQAETSERRAVHPAVRPRRRRRPEPERAALTSPRPADGEPPVSGPESPLPATPELGSPPGEARAAGEGEAPPKKRRRRRRRKPAGERGETAPAEGPVVAVEQQTADS